MAGQSAKNQSASAAVQEPARVHGHVVVAGQTLPVYIGEITEVMPASGVGVLQIGNGQHFAFRFAAIPEFFGNTTMSLGLQVGAKVEFAVKSGEVVYAQVPKG